MLLAVLASAPATQVPADHGGFVVFVFLERFWSGLTVRICKDFGEMSPLCSWVNDIATLDIHTLQGKDKRDLDQLGVWP